MRRITQAEIQAIQQVVKGLFWDTKHNKPLELTEGQAEIFWSVYNPDLRRVQIMTTTQYGKSLTIALAVLYLAVTKNLKVALIAPSQAQALIIMDYIIEHLFDNKSFLTGLIDVEGVDKMRTQRSRDRLQWVQGAEIRVLTVSASQQQKAGLGLMGFHADVIITDESALIPDIHYFKIMRMLGGDLGLSKIVKIGNPFFRNHFYKSWISDGWYKLKIDWRRAVAEGRLTIEFVEEMRTTMIGDKDGFAVMYDVEFPSNLSIDALFDFEVCDKMWLPKELILDDGITVAGLDLSRGGGDDTILSILDVDDNNAKLHKQVQFVDTKDSIKLANNVYDEIVNFIHPDKKGKKVEILSYDALGLGGPIGDYLYNLPIEQQVFDIVEYKAGNKAINRNYANIKSQILYTMRIWGEQGRIDFSKGSGQMRTDLLGYTKRRLSDRAVKIDDPVDSPDYADSVCAGLFAVWGANIPNITIAK